MVTPPARAVLLAGAVLISVVAGRAQPRVQALVSDKQVVTGTSLTLEVRSEGGDIRSVSMVGLEGFSVISGPATSRSVQIINGVVSTTSSYSWTLLPRKVGTLVIPALAVNVEGNIVHTEPVAIEVLSPSAAAAGAGQQRESLFLVADVDRRQAYRGEQITVTWTLYTQLGISGWEIASLPNLTGFWTEELFAPNKLQLREKVVAGQRYYTAVVRRQALFPTRSGQLHIDPLVMKVGVQDRSRRRRDPFFDDFSLFGRGRVSQKTISAPSVTIDVRPVPERGRPADFSGMVGDFSLHGRLAPKQVTQDEAVTLTLTVSGEGNFKALEYPLLNLPRGLEVFDPKVSIEPSLGDIVGGSATIEHVIIPRQAGSYTIPPLRLPYFDPQRGAYEVATTGPFALTVLPRPENLASAPGFTRREVALLGQDIRFVKSGRVHWLRTGEGWYTTGLFLLNMATVLFFAAPWMGARARILATAVQPALRARRALTAALPMLERTDDPEDPHGAISRVVAAYLNHKLGRETQEYGLDQVRTLLAGAHVTPAVQDALVALLERSAAARFAPPGSVDSGADRHVLKDVLRRVDSQWSG